MRRAIRNFLAAILATGCAMAFAAPGEALPAISDSASIFTGPDAVCRSWSDGCRICARRESGRIVCSNIGHMCKPGELKRSDREAD